MEKQSPSQTHQSENQDRNQGRVPEQDEQQISRLDQQEGHMNNGALGGNFSETIEDRNPEKR